MSQTNAPNVALTATEMRLLRHVFINGNSATTKEVQEEHAREGIPASQVDLMLSMLVAQQFLTKQAVPRTPGGYMFSITLKAIKRIRADNAAVRASDRQPAVVKV